MSALNTLIEALRHLPGVGPKSAQRMAFHLLKKERHKGLSLAKALEKAMQEIKSCARCRNYTEYTLCKLCEDPKRENKLLCVVEGPADLAAIEQAQAFSGKYFVLMGKISPLDGLGPEEIGLTPLKNLVINECIEELILALSPSIEGQTTAHFIQQLLSAHPVKITLLAQGIPRGGELEYLDTYTISTALKNRSAI